MVPNKQITYKDIYQEGKDHQKLLYVDVYVDDEKMGSGSGIRKIIAERNVAKEAIEKIKNIPVIVTEVNYYYKNWLQERFPHEYIEYVLTNQIAELNAAKDALEKLRQ